MCGSFTQPGDIEIVKRFSGQYGLSVTVAPNENPEQPPPAGKNVMAHPYRDVWIVYTDREGNHRLTGMYWELINNWCKEFKSPYTNFNTRVESLGKPNNAMLLESRRCVFPVTSFFETGKTAEGKVIKPCRAYEFSLKKDGLIALGGIYTVWRNPENEDDRRLSCSLITMEPNEIVGEIHPRMPFILAPEAVKPWLDRAITDLDAIMKLIQPFDSAGLRRTGESEESRGPEKSSAPPTLF